MKKLLVLAVLAVALIATPAMAKEGFYLGGYIPFTGISGDSRDAFDDAYFGSLDGGAGLGLRVGIGLNRYLALEGSLFRSIHPTNLVIAGIPIEDQEFTGQTLDLKLNFPLTGSEVEPYILVGVGTYQFGDSGGTYYKGTGNQFGVGLDMYVAPELSFNVGLTWRNITIDSGDAVSPIYDSHLDTSTLDIGLTYHFL